MSRVEFLKKFVAFNKKHKVPIGLIKLQLYIIFLTCFAYYGLTKLVNGIKYVLSYPFIKFAECFKKNSRAIIKVECIVSIVGIALLVIAQYGQRDLEAKDLGALSGETYQSGQMGNVSEEAQSSLHNMNVGNISNVESEEETDIAEEVIADTDNSDKVNETNLLPYKIKVNRLLNCITIYTLDNNNEYSVPYKAMICSTGDKETPLGSFKISTKYDFKELFFNSYGQYCSRIRGSILFHSSGNNSLNKADLNAEDFNNLGKGVSHGCIRLTVEDAKWIFDNCPTGTVVDIFEDVNEGPLGKPECIKVPAGTHWDPTDPDENNPWNDATPCIEGVSDKVLFEKDVVNILAGIKAYDTCGNDITDKLVVEGDVNIDIPGDYVIKYSITDLLGRTAEESAIYTVR